MSYVDVILPVPLEGTFTYSLPQGMEEAARVGMRVLVEFGNSKKYTGIVSRVHDEEPKDYKVKDVLELIDDAPILTDEQLRLWRWIADYYMSPIGDVYRAAVPAGLKNKDGYKPKTETCVRLTKNYRNETALHIALNTLARSRKQMEVFNEYLHLSHWDTISGTATAEPTVDITREELMNSSHGTAANVRELVRRGLLETYEKEVGRLNDSFAETELRPPGRLSEQQQAAMDEIYRSFDKKNVVLLHGVTSSGKTEIYINMISRAISEGKQVLYLLPEIALTVQIMERLKRVFGARLGIYHSKYSDEERVEIWQKQLSSSPYDVVIGARSAVFLPFRRLGLVIVDEEHESSFKQQDPAPRYHARSAAIVLASMCGAKTLLGTATPSMESYHNARTGKYGLVELKQRYHGLQLPEILVVDIKDLQRRKMMNGPFSPVLLTRMREALGRGEQVILFQNRRGFAPMIECNECGWVPHCQHCDVSLTLHKTTDTLTCHYCGYTYTVPRACPCCGSKDLRGRGFGTEKIEDSVGEIFPDARVARLDLDTTRTRNAYERIIDDFALGRTNILIGTQMVSKGLDFDRVSVVGILNADSMMNVPDFRAYEQAYMMMAQVSGRAGRKGKRGLVLLQTKTPDSPVIDYVVRNDYESLYKSLIAERQEFRYPPYCHLIYIYAKHKDNAVAERASMDMGARLRQWFGARVLGPDKPAVARVKAMNIRKLVLKIENGIDMGKVRRYLRLLQSQTLADKRYRSLNIVFDVDPL